MKKINTVNQKSLPERTADAIVSMLHMENYKAGAKLPNELQMAQRFEVSRSTIRLAEKTSCRQKYPGHSARCRNFCFS